VTERPTYIDSHAHLDDPQFDEDRDQVIDDAVSAGVTTIVNIGYRPSVWETTLALADRRPEIRYTLGLHPGHADEGNDELIDALEDLVVDRRPVAIGEIGIDLYWQRDNLGKQVDMFERQIELAMRHDLPIVIHQRDAADAVLGVLTIAPTGLRVLFHSFDGSPNIARLADERGWMLGVGGMMTRRQSEDLRNYLATVELARIVLETDSPYLVPSGIKSRRNTPSAIPLIAERLAGLIGRDSNEIAEITSANACAFFRINQASVA
jgi:TatD DNase family protein